MSLFSRTDERELSLIIDIQSSMIRGSLIYTPPKSADPKAPAPKTTVVFTYNADIPWKPRTDSSYLVKITMKSLSEVVEAVLRYLHSPTAHGRTRVHMSSVHVALSSPWIMTEAKNLEQTFERDSQVTREFVRKMIEQQRLKLAAPEQDLIMVEQKIFDVRLNGYSVPVWTGKYAKNIEVAYTMSVAPRRVIERFRETCSRLVKPEKVIFHSSLMLQFVGMRTAMPNEGNYALLHIHGEMTDVAVMSHNSCIFSGTYQFGTHTFVRKIAQTTGSNLQAADSLLALYTGGHVDAVHGKSDVEAISAISTGWISEFKKCTAGLALPRRALISALAHDDLFAKIVSLAFPDWRVDIISIEDIAPHLVFENGAERRRLTGLYALAVNSLEE